jgi:hypothetical protein
MPNDAKLGLILGVGVVIAVTVVFFRKDGRSLPPAAGEPAAAAVNPPGAAATGGSHAPERPVKAKATAQTAETTGDPPSDQRHTVAPDGTEGPVSPVEKGGGF